MSIVFKTESVGDDIRVTIREASFLLLQIVKSDPHLALLSDAELGELIHQVDSSPWARTNKVAVEALNYALGARDLSITHLPICV